MTIAYGIYRHRSRSGRCHSFDLYTFAGGRPQRETTPEAIERSGLARSRAFPGSVTFMSDGRDIAARLACARLGLVFGGWL